MDTVTDCTWHMEYQHDSGHPDHQTVARPVVPEISLTYCVYVPGRKEFRRLKKNRITGERRKRKVRRDSAMITGIHHISMKCGSAEEMRKAREFYLDILGFSVVREWPEGIMIDSGNGCLEIFCNGKGIRSKGALRHIAFSTDDTDGIAVKVRNAGYEVFIEPKDIVIRSEPEYPARMAFCYGPLGEEIEFFQERRNGR